MKYLSLLVIPLIIVSCQNNNSNPSGEESVKVDSQTLENTNKKPDGQPVVDSSKISKQKLALTSDALQLVDATTGSTREISFGMSYDSLVTIISRVLVAEPISQDVNSECGAGPLKMARWSNGLTLVFSETKRGNEAWKFKGWFAGKPTDKLNPPTTMAGIGVGSTVEELKSAYVTSVTKTTLGQEFSVKSGFYGILSGPGEDATIEVMWSGVSCNFR